MMNGDKFGTVGKGALDLHVVYHFRDAGQDLVSSQQLASKIHQFGDAAAIPDEFQEDGRDKSDGFGMVQAQAAREALLREAAGLVEREFVEFAGAEVHGVGQRVISD